MRSKSWLIVGASFSLWVGAQPGQTVQKTFQGVRRIEVDNVWGSIHVTASEGSEAVLIAREAYRAGTAEDLARMRQEVKLDLSQRDSAVRAYVDGPFRCNCREGDRGWGRRRSRDEEARYDFEIRAPRAAALWLRTVNRGEIWVNGLDGEFDIETVNGGIELASMSGSGHAKTVNGPVRARFRENPKGKTSFGSINGEIDLVFRPGLSADLRLKTFNGNIYSDFMVDALPARAIHTERRGGKTIFRSDGYTGARIGAGGPEILIDGFNGDIRIRNGS